ncbi:GtrA family protein [Pseudomonas sp.]|uniref:GtrA family protein n=1 Tax=Pseudomonas sp. TaxID=306 RepID=UPI001B13AB48|nr:GtrA family protein [Pseudomonas sp.]MBO9552003.1 GtrA family protein [Pseudomonas sp.]
MSASQGRLVDLFRKGTRYPIVRYGIVGVLNNLRGYLIYLLLTWLWLEPKTAVTIMYPVSAAMAYFGHARYSFSYQGSARYGALRYCIAHVIGYTASIGILYVLSDKLGFAHQLVRIFAIFAVAGILYILYRYFVFPNRPTSP